MVHLLPAIALNNESDGDVIAGNRSVTNGTNRVEKASKITQCGDGKIDESAINAG